MTFLCSAKLDQWFKDNEHYDGFWDFVDGLYDAQEWVGDETYNLFERGFNLAKEAGDQSVYQYATDDLTLYFIGTEEKVLSGLVARIADWLENYPQETEKDQKCSRLQKQLEKAKLDLQLKQSNLDYLQKAIKQVDSPD